MAGTKSFIESLKAILNWSRKQWLIIACILIVAAGLRFYKLGIIPEGITWDEAAIGYDGWAIWMYRRDEWLNFLPISFQSFGDYKAPLALYLNGFFTLLLGHEPWVIRLPFALSGLASVLGVMVLIKILLFSDKTDKSASKTEAVVPLIIGALMAVNPWHVHFSRIGIESLIALFFMIWGVVFLSLAYKIKQAGKMEYLLYILSAIFLASSIYTYHSTKIVVPLLLLLLFVYQLVRRMNFKPILLTGIATVLLLLPMGYDMIFGNGSARFSQTTVFNPDTPFSTSIMLTAQNYLQHFSPNFLIYGGTNTNRHGDGRWGVFFSTELFLLIFSFVLAGWSYQKKKKVEPLLLIGCVWVLTSLLPAAIGKEIPHPSRALLALPGYYMIISVGLEKIVEFGVKKEKRQILYSLGTLFVVIHGVLLGSYLKNYYTNFAADSSEDFLAGYTQAVKVAVEHQNDREVIFTNQYGQAHMFFLLVKKISPMEYQYGALNRFKIVDKVMPTDIDQPNRLVVATPKELDPSVGTQLILSQSGEVRFVIVDTVERCEKLGQACPPEFER